VPRLDRLGQGVSSYIQGLPKTLLAEDGQAVAPVHSCTRAFVHPCIRAPVHPGVSVMGILVGWSG